MSTKFSIKDIESDGWIRGYKYIARGNPYEWEYNKRIPEHDFFTRTITIVFDETGNITELLTRSGCPQRNITDMKDLNHYFINNE